MGADDVLRLSTGLVGALSLKWGKRHNDLHGACFFKGQSRSLMCDASIVYLKASFMLSFGFKFIVYIILFVMQ